MRQSPAVDVIIPVYNQFHVVKPCVDSVVSSMQWNDFHLVVIDDASTDRDVRRYLEEQARRGVLELHGNKVNLGFTRTVNKAMSIRNNTDVVLLNSDTVVHGAWLERLKSAAYSDPRVATVNPMTNGSHVSGYPFRHGNEGVVLEITEDVLDELALEKNPGVYVDVYATVGFCMYIKRDCLNSIGFFDDRHFPIGYGEESDFCARARAVGWRHLITGDTFVLHKENQSFGEKKRILVEHMHKKISELHPNYIKYDEDFLIRDPLRSIRTSLDLARLRKLRKDWHSLHIYSEGQQESLGRADDVYLVGEGASDFRLASRRREVLPNLPVYNMPRDVVRFNADMAYLGVEKLVWQDGADRCWSAFRRLVPSRSIETGLWPELLVAADAYAASAGIGGRL
jgi:GT2 family glycosyltransferase